MLNKVTKICKPIFQRSICNFGGGHGAPVKIDINKEATWIKYNTTRKLACVEGVTDTHIPLPDLMEVDAAEYARNAPWYDLEVFFHGEAFYHSLSHEPNSGGQQGYTLTDDPNDARFDLIAPLIYTILTGITLMGLREYSDIYATKSQAEIVLEADYLQSLVDEKLSQKANRIQALQAEIRQSRS